MHTHAHTHTHTSHTSHITHTSHRIMDQLVHNIQQVFPDLSSLQIVEKIKECNFDIDQAVEQMFEEQQNSTEVTTTIYIALFA